MANEEMRMVPGGFRQGSLIAAVLLVAGCIEASAASTQIKAGPDGRATAISNMVAQDNCLPARVKGRVVKRNYGPPGVTLVGVTIQEAGGTKTFVNVDSEYERKDRQTAGKIKDALDVLLAVGKRVDLGVYGCGASGSVNIIHSIKAI